MTTSILTPVPTAVPVMIDSDAATSFPNLKALDRLTESGATPGQAAPDLARALDCLLAVAEYMNRIRPVLAVFNNPEPMVPLGVVHVFFQCVKVVERIQASMSAWDNLRHTSCRELDGFGDALVRVFDPSHQNGNRWSTFDALRRRVDRTVDELREELDRRTQSSFPRCGSAAR